MAPGSGRWAQANPMANSSTSRSSGRHAVSTRPAAWASPSDDSWHLRAVSVANYNRSPRGCVLVIHPVHRPQYLWSDEHPVLAPASYLHQNALFDELSDRLVSSLERLAQQVLYGRYINDWVSN